MSGNNLSNNPGMASTAQSSTDWPRLSRNDIEQIQQKLKLKGSIVAKSTVWSDRKPNTRCALFSANTVCL